ncbi:MAG: cupin domain-containing protein, partial [Armatimonadota bacterium]
HIHLDEDEAFYVLEGRLSYQLGSRHAEASAGSLVFIPRGTVHAFSNIGPQPARLLFILAPAGFEHFFEEVGEIARSRSLPEPPGPPNLDQLAVLAKKYHYRLG